MPTPPSPVRDPSDNLLRLICLRAKDKAFSATTVTDGAPIYPLATCFFNLVAKQQGLNVHLSHKVVPGLRGKHPFRRIKNIIERFFSTFRFAAKPLRGFKCFNSALAFVTIFAFYYNYFRPHLSLALDTPADLKDIQPDQNAIQQWTKLILLAFDSS